MDLTFGSAYMRENHFYHELSQM